MNGGEDMEHLKYLGVGLGAMLIVGVAMWFLMLLLDWVDRRPCWVERAVWAVLLLALFYLAGYWLLN